MAWRRGPPVSVPSGAAILWSGWRGSRAAPSLFNLASLSQEGTGGQTTPPFLLVSGKIVLRPVRFLKGGGCWRVRTRLVT